MTRTAGAPMGCQRPSRFWGLGCPKIYHEAEDTLGPQSMVAWYWPCPTAWRSAASKRTTWAWCVICWGCWHELPT
ncbi:hypothetical protein, partial [Thiolapillus sp.]|uniref:hypothetical protein n=1 Tax=Thiolapillus sp. TaxID=2017437 RepID=UPI003AF595F7